MKTLGLELLVRSKLQAKSFTLQNNNIKCNINYIFYLAFRAEVLTQILKKTQKLIPRQFRLKSKSKTILIYSDIHGLLVRKAGLGLKCHCFVDGWDKFPLHIWLRCL